MATYLIQGPSSLVRFIKSGSNGNALTFDRIADTNTAARFDTMKD